MSSAVPNLDAATLDWIHSFAPYGVIALDLDLRVRSWNRWMEVHSGLNQADTLGKKLNELYPELQGKRSAAQFERVLNGEISVLSTALHGHLIPLRPVAHGVDYPFMKQTARIAPLITDKQIGGMIIVIEDVTQREWQAGLLQQQRVRDELLSWALAHLLKAEAPRETSGELFRKVSEHLDFETYLFYLCDAEEGLKLLAWHGVPPKVVETLRKTADDGWLCGASDPQAVIGQKVQASKDPALQWARDLGLTAYVALPMVGAARLQGVIFFGTRSRDKITAEEADLLSSIAQHLGVALQRDADARELLKAQETLSRHADELEEKIAARTATLEDTIADLQTFSYTVAHDLQAPIRAFKGYCQVLLEDYGRELPPDAQELLQRLHRACDQMGHLTRDLLAFSAVSRHNIELTEVSLDEIVAQVINSGSPSMAPFTTIAGPLGSVIGSPSLIGECVSQLMANAAKFVRLGESPRITITALETEQAAPQGASWATVFNRSRYSHADAHEASKTKAEAPAKRPRRRIYFEDSGIGVPAEAREKIFGIFDRGFVTSEFGGTGIGLAIVSRAMERMNGTCGVEPGPEGKGSRFWLEFRTPKSPAPQGEPR